MIFRYAAGVIDGHRHVWWSNHSTLELARAAARRYQRGLQHQTGGAGSWFGWVRWPDGRIEAVDDPGESK